VNNSLLVQLVVTGILSGTPLLLAALGELIAERSGVMNLGLEGMMLMGAVSAFWVSQRLGGPGGLVLVVAILVAGIVGLLMSLIHAFVTITLRGNQTVSGLALTIFGGAVGLSSYLGQVGNLTGHPGRHQLQNIDVFGLKDLALAGPILFNENALVYASWALVLIAAVYLNRTRPGLNLRAVGEDPSAAESMGINVIRYRYIHTLIGGVLAGVAGSSFSLALTPSWGQGLTAGAGWIALALVIFAFWRPGLVLLASYLFGAITGLGFILQTRGVQLAPELFSSLPYLMTIVTLVLVSSTWTKSRFGAPAALGVSYAREG
jgi:ABC-type uncharacterized transport system permease subunit